MAFRFQAELFLALVKGVVDESLEFIERRIRVVGEVGGAVPGLERGVLRRILAQRRLGGRERGQCFVELLNLVFAITQFRKTVAMHQPRGVGKPFLVVPAPQAGERQRAQRERAHLPGLDPERPVELAEGVLGAAMHEQAFAGGDERAVVLGIEPRRLVEGAHRIVGYTVPRRLWPPAKPGCAAVIFLKSSKACSKRLAPMRASASEFCSFWRLLLSPSTFSACSQHSIAWSNLPCWCSTSARFTWPPAYRGFFFTRSNNMASAGANSASCALTRARLLSASAAPGSTDSAWR